MYKKLYKKKKRKNAQKICKIDMYRQHQRSPGMMVFNGITDIYRSSIVRRVRGRQRSSFNIGIDVRPPVNDHDVRSSDSKSERKNMPSIWHA